MDERQDLSLEDQFASAQDWWRDAGVDCLFLDEPVNWLQPPEPDTSPGDAPGAGSSSPADLSGAAVEAEAAPPMGGDADGWPSELAAFAPWWLAEPSLDEGGGSPRIPPHGPRGAELMIVVPMPEAEDRDRLLSGPQGRLIGNMLAALGIEGEATYFASALPRHMPMPDWQALGTSGLGDVLQHHIALARPVNVLIMGRDLAAFLGQSKPAGAAWSGKVGAEESPVPALVSYGPDTLLERPQFRKALWHHLLDWMEKPA